MPPTLIRFIVTGLGNTILGLSIVGVCGLVLSPTISNLLAYLVVVPISFFTHRQLSFRDNGRLSLSFMRYLTMVAFGYAINLATLHFALHHGAASFLSQLAAIGVYVVFCYLASKHFVFRNPRLLES